jgi:hypothetical protein
LDVTPFPTLLAWIARSGWSGSLLLRRDQVKKVVFVQDGVALAVKSNLLYECLGRLLVREGVISEEQCEHSVRAVKTERRMQGEVLIEMGALAASALGPALQRQFHTKLFDVFGWGQGLYRLRDGVGEGGRDMGPMSEPAELILSGVRQAYPADRIRIDLAAYMAQTPTLLVARRDLETLRLSGGESEWADLLDGRRTLASIVSATGGPEGIYRLVYALICLGVLSFRTAE